MNLIPGRMHGDWDGDNFRLFFTYFEVCKTPVRSPGSNKQQSYRLPKIPISQEKCIFSVIFLEDPSNPLKTDPDLQISTHWSKLYPPKKRVGDTFCYRQVKYTRRLGHVFTQFQLD